MLHATLKSLLSRKLRLTLSGLAVVLGVMFVSGAFVLTATLKGSFDSLFTSAFSDVDVSVSAKARTAAEEADQSVPTVPTSVLDRIRTTPGAAGATGEVRADGARIIGSNGKVVTTMGAPRFGSGWTGESSFVQLREGRGPSADDEIAVNAAVAEAAGVHVGDRVAVLTQQPKRMFTLVGIYGYAGNKDSMSGAHEISFTPGAAQELLLGQRGLYTSVKVDAAAGTSVTALRDSLKGALGDAYQVRTGKELQEAANKEYSAGLGFFNKVLLGFAAVALFVGVFLILNTFSIIIAQRTKELALMRAMGANRRQVITSVLVEATAIGLIASALGLAAGIGVGALLGWVFGEWADMPLDGLKIPASAVISAFAVGIPITLLAALLPAVRAAKIAPIAAMREASGTDRPLTKLTVSGALITVLGGGLLWTGLSGTGDASLLLLGAGVLVIFLGVALLTPLLARPVVTVVGALFAWSVPGKLGRLNSKRNPRRTAITAAALMIGLALIAGMSVIVSSVNTTVEKRVASDLKLDLFIGRDMNSESQATFDRSVLDRTAKLAGVERVVGEYDDYIKVSSAAVKDSVDYIGATADLAGEVDMFSLDATSGTIDAVGPGQAIVDKNRAERYKLKVGDTVTMQFSKGEPRTVTVVGIYEGGMFMSGWLTGTDVVADFGSQQPAWGFIELADGASVSAVRKQIDAMLADNPEISVSPLDSLTKQVTDSTKQVLMMVQILLGLAVLIAILGIVNTLALSIIERTRELGMLRAIGLRRGQMMRMITTESMVISLFGAVLGLAVGSGMGIAVVKALKTEGISSVSLPWGEFGMYLGIAAVVGVIAAAVPAIRAARVNVLAAIASE